MCRRCRSRGCLTTFILCALVNQGAEQLKGTVLTLMGAWTSQWCPGRHCKNPTVSLTNNVFVVRRSWKSDVRESGLMLFELQKQMWHLGLVWRWKWNLHEDDLVIRHRWCTGAESGMTRLKVWFLVCMWVNGCASWGEGSPGWGEILLQWHWKECSHESSSLQVKGC